MSFTNPSLLESPGVLSHWQGIELSLSILLGCGLFFSKSNFSSDPEKEKKRHKLERGFTEFFQRRKLEFRNLHTHSVEISVFYSHTDFT